MFCGALACCACCGNCAACCNVKASRQARIPYVFILIGGVILAIILRSFGEEITINLYVFGEYKPCAADSYACWGNEAVFRVLFVLFSFFLIMSLLLIPKGMHAVHAEFWFIKILYLLGILVLSFALPDSSVFFDSFAEFCRFAAALFILLQILVLVHGAYELNKKWMKNDDEGWSKEAMSNIALSLLLFGGSLTFLILFYGWFAEGGSCNMERFIITMSIIFGVVLTVLSVMPFIQKYNNEAALLPSCVIFAYSTFLCYSSLYSNKDTKCNKIGGGEGTSYQIQVIVGVVIACLAIIISAWRLSSVKNLFSLEEDDGDVDVSNLVIDMPKTVGGKDGDEATEKKPEENENIEDKKDDDLTPEQKSIAQKATTYLVMILSNWKSDSSKEGLNFDNNDSDNVTMWIKLVTQWLVFLLYGWTLLAPFLFPERFGVNLDD